MKPERIPNLTAFFAVMLLLFGGLGGYLIGHKNGMAANASEHEAQKQQQDFSIADQVARAMNRNNVPPPETSLIEWHGRVDLMPIYYKDVNGHRLTRRNLGVWPMLVDEKRPNVMFDLDGYRFEWSEQPSHSFGIVHSEPSLFTGKTLAESKDQSREN